MEKGIKGIIRDQSGAALVIALLMMVTLTLIGLGSLLTSTFEIKVSGNKRGSTDAFYAADSGVQVLMANIKNFDLPGKYTDNQYNPFEDPDNPNPTEVKATIYYIPEQHGSPRGAGVSATHFEFIYFNIRTTGEDQTELFTVKSRCSIEEKVVRLIPTMQGGY